MNQDDYIKQRLNVQINWYDKKSISNQKWFKFFQIITIIAAAAIPFLSGFLTVDSLILKVIVGFLGVTIAINTSILGLNKFQENWIEYRTICESLKHEKYLFLTNSEPYDKSSFNLFVQRVESLISKENSVWNQLMKKNKSKKNNVKAI